MLVLYSDLGGKRSAGKLGGTGYSLLCTGTWDVIIMSARKLGNILAISIMSALCWDVGGSGELSARKLGDVPIMSALYSNLGGL